MREQTLIKFLLQYKGALEAMLNSIVRDPIQAEDLFQEVALIMAQKREEVDEDCNFMGWGRRISMNVVRKYWGKRSRDRRLLFLDDKALEIVASYFEKTAQSVWESRKLALNECINSLSQEHRNLIRSKYENKSSINELSTTLSKSPRSVDNLLYRIRKALRKCVQNRLQSWGCLSET